MDYKRNMQLKGRLNLCVLAEGRWHLLKGCNLDCTTRVNDWTSERVNASTCQRVNVSTCQRVNV